MKTRYYLQVLFAMALALPISIAADGQTRQQKDVCVQLYSVRDLLKGVNKDGNAEAKYTELLAQLGQMGYTSVEAANYDQSKGTFYGRLPEDFKKDIEAAGMNVLSSHTSHALSETELASGDFSESLAWWKKCISDHKRAGMKYIVCPWMSVPKTLKDLQTYCRYYNAVGKMCKEAGMQFGYHNHAHEFQKVEDSVMYDYMIQNTAPEYVFYQIDLYWAVRGGASPVAYFKQYPGRFKMFHVKDDKEIGQSGMVGFDAIFHNAATAGLQDYVIEVEGYTMPIVESVKVSLDYVLEAPFIKVSYSE